MTSDRLDAWIDPLDLDDGPDGRPCAACGTPFQPPRPQSRYCCEDCRKAFVAFRVARGAALVEPLIRYATGRSSRDPRRREEAKRAFRYLDQRGRALAREIGRAGR